MNSFLCRACGDKSPVRMVKAASGQTYLICTHCGAEHALRFHATASDGQLPEVEIVGLRDSGASSIQAPSRASSQ
jgi:hypothetical protein